MAKSSNSSGGKKNKKKMSFRKKNLLSASNAVAMKSKSSLENPFESIWSRRKFDIIGKKRKGEERRVGLARSLAIQKRKTTLLKEYEKSGKSSLFVDRRIGEQDDALGEFDKAILRFQRERQTRLSKKSIYHLSDEEDDDIALGSLSARDDFEDDLLLDDYVDGNEMENKPSISKHVAAHNSQNHMEAASIESEENKHKSKKEIMAEIIFKSKQAKAEKAKGKEEDERLLEQLDKDFSSLVQSQALSSLTQRSKMAALKSFLDKGNTNEMRKIDDKPMTSINKELSNQEQPDAYDKLVKEMALDMRACPSDRTKTPEELAQEERERLEHLEEERQKRMAAPDYSSDEDGIDHIDNNSTSIAKRRSSSGDDLGDSFSLDKESRNKKGWVDEILERDATSSENENDSLSIEGSESDESDTHQESEDDGNPPNPMSLQDWEQSDDENFSTDMEEEDKEGEEVEGMDRRSIRKKEEDIAPKIKAKKEDPSTSEKRKTSGEQVMGHLDTLPFVLEAPSSLAELCALLDNRTDAEVVEGISRIRACNAIKLASENRKKMQVFYGVLLQYFAVVANRKPSNFRLLNSLVKPLMEMSMGTPYFAAICARQRLIRIRTQLCEDIKNQERDCWPSLKTLLLLRLWSIIFPCSDFRHVVITPAILLMCEYLMCCPIKSNRDIAIGSFICSMVLSFSRESKKFCPEAIAFLQTLLLSAIAQGPLLFRYSQSCYLSELKLLKPWLWVGAPVSEVQALDFLFLMDLPEDSPFFNSDVFRVGMLVSVIESLRGFVKIYEEHNSFPEIFCPISAVLHEVVKQEHMPDALRSNMIDGAQLITVKADEICMLRQPLQMRKLKPVPIKLLNPKFEEDFVKGRDYDPDRERAERKKLKKLLKSEAKGAARELRKDNNFLLEAKEKERKKLEIEKAEKYNRAKTFLQEQGHAYRSGQLGKGRKRRR
ncbi:hypothetical protein Scep_024450 [Stephania cephalantha]|uniref:Nucleolar protein 14 n=1 Tax=Stephania cephalantha TaxID=152367 RepID=A0AAP0EWK4_9MAGN